MRNPARIPIVLGKLQIVWEVIPDLRLMQLLTNIVGYTGWRDDPFYFEDNKLEEMLDECIERINESKRRKTK